MPRVGTIGLGLTLFASIAACQSTGRLDEYDFAQKTIAAVYDFPPYPEVLTGPYFPGHPKDPIHALMRVGSAIAKEVAASGAREKLDSASVMVDIAGRTTERASQRVARFLRADLVADEASADFVFEVRIRDYGIDATTWNAAAHVFVDAEVLLLDGVDGSEIWESRVQEREAIAPHIFGPRPARTLRDIVTAAALANMSTEDMARALEHLADFAADRVSERLRDSLEEVRDRRR